MVKIYVGPKRKEFIVHKTLICKSADYFDKAYNGKFKEAGGEMHLEEEGPGMFSLFVDWIYRSSLPKGYTQEYLDNLVDLYLFGEKICSTSLKDKTIDTIQDLVFKYNLGASLVKGKFLGKVLEGVSEYPGLKKFCLYMMVDYYHRRNTSSTQNNGPICLSDTDLKEIWGFIGNDFLMFSNFYQRMAYLLLKTIRSDYKYRNPFNRFLNTADTCLFHCHAEDHKCQGNLVMDDPDFVDDKGSKIKAVR